MVNQFSAHILDAMATVSGVVLFIDFMITIPKYNLLFISIIHKGVLEFV